MFALLYIRFIRQKTFLNDFQNIILKLHSITNDNFIILFILFIILFMNFIQKLPEIYTFLTSYYAIFALSVIVYFVYRWYFKGIVFKTIGNYDQKLKNIGRPLPPYPNGWFIVLHSRDLKNGQSTYVDINGENLVVFRSDSGEPYILEAYCKHLGANLGMDGKVVNKKCIQCPFHGWLYDGETGICVDHNGKPVPGKAVEYNDDFCEKGGKLKWKTYESENVKLRKYPVCEMNGYIYVWIHAMPEHQEKPIYPMIDISDVLSDLEYRATTVHHIKSHVQDIPENGSDIYHFKYVHTEIIPKINAISFLWKAKWKRADDPDIKEMFTHDVKYIRQFKNMLYEKYIEPFPEKRFISVGYLDNYVNFPILGPKYQFNVTILQVGCSTVFILLKSPLFTIVLFHYLQPKEKYYNVVYHEGYTSKWLPYWASALGVRMEGSQVTSDMYIWDSKKFGRKIYYKEGDVADEFIRGWREWYSQHYEGCLEKERSRETW